MKNQTILVTGALTGIGRATAIAFAKEGAKLVVSGRHDDKGQELVAALRSLGAEAEFIKADVRHEGEVKNLVENVFLSLNHEMRVMQEQKGGSIVNVTSTLGHRGTPGASLYAASKHAVEGLTQSAALEGASFGVRVNSVAPDPTDTGMLTRFTGTPENKAALLLESPSIAWEALKN